MPKLITICLTKEQQEKLEQLRDTHKCAYMRERVTAILKIADGMSGREVALTGLLKRRKPDTVYDWVKRYRQEGIAGLPVKPGRGRKPAYWPKYQSEAEAKEAILHTVRRDPSMFASSSMFDPLRSRWSLCFLADACDWLQVDTVSGMSKLLKRLRISYKRGRSYIHSPDPYYQRKMDIIHQSLLKAWYAPEKYVLLYQDEFGCYRQPTIARDYEAMGKFQPLARRSRSPNAEFKGIGALNSVTGQVTYHQASKVNIKELTVFYDMVAADYPRKTYPNLDTIYLVQDNWPVHFHPDVLAHLQPQHLEFPVYVPGHWPKKPTPRARHANLSIKILQLPTYASWANPIEKLWRWVRQTVIHLHRLSDDWSILKQRVQDFILSFRHGSNELLRYVGLLPD
jgi:transposase